MAAWPLPARHVGPQEPEEAQSNELGISSERSPAQALSAERPGPSLPGCVTLSKALDVSELQFPHVFSREEDWACLVSGHEDEIGCCM